MSRSYTWEEVDQLAVQWYELPEEGNNAAKKSLEERLFCAAMELLGKSGQKGAVDALGEFWLNDWQRFDPKQSPMSHFLRSRLRLRSRDLNRQDNDLRKKTKDGKTSTICNESLNNEEASVQTADIKDWRAETALEDTLLDERAYECLALILELPVRLRGRSNNPDKINYYRLFFTDGITNYIRSNPVHIFFAHERELFQAMRLSFLDYFLTWACRTLPAISESDTKLYGELVEDRPMEPVEQPLPNDVYSAYMSRVEKRNAGTSAISQQRTAYRAFLKETLC